MNRFNLKAPYTSRAHHTASRDFRPPSLPLLPPPHLLKAGADDGDPVLDGGDRVGVALGEDGLAHARRRVDRGALLLHGAHEVPVRVQQRLQRVRLLRQHAAEPQRLLRLRQPLQEDLHVGAELLRLRGAGVRAELASGGD